MLFGFGAVVISRVEVILIYATTVVILLLMIHNFPLVVPNTGLWPYIWCRLNGSKPICFFSLNVNKFEGSVDQGRASIDRAAVDDPLMVRVATSVATFSVIFICCWRSGRYDVLSFCYCSQASRIFTFFTRRLPTIRLMTLILLSLLLRRTINLNMTIISSSILWLICVIKARFNLLRTRFDDLSQVVIVKAKFLHTCLDSVPRSTRSHFVMRRT